MNAHQRRKAYREQPQVGAIVEWTTSRGTQKRGTVTGHKLPRHGQWNEERLNVPCVRRVRVQLDSGGFVHPLVKILRVTN